MIGGKIWHKIFVASTSLIVQIRSNCKGPQVNLCVALALFVCTGCSLSKTLPEGEHLYQKAELKIISTDKTVPLGKLKSTCEDLINTTQANNKFFGVRWGLRLHNLFENKKEKGLLHWLQKGLGEAPVIYDDRVTTRVEQLLQNRAFNTGFFHTTVTTEVKKTKRRARVKYTLLVEPPFRIDTISNNIEHPAIRKQIENIQAGSLLEPTQMYQLDLLKQERERIVLALRQTGYYFFSSDFLVFRADTMQTSQKVQLSLHLKDNLDSMALQVQKIHQITVYPNADFKQRDSIFQDTVFFEDLKIIGSDELIRPTVLREVITLKSGELYSSVDHQSTLRRLSFLRNFQFIDVKFTPSPLSDSLLDASIYLIPQKQHRVEGSLAAAVSPGVSFGPEISLSYLNRNTFHGAEQFRVSFSGNYNFPLHNDFSYLREQEISFELTKPGILIPFKEKRWASHLIAQSKLSAVIDNNKITLPLNGTQDFLAEVGFTTLAEELAQDTSFAPFVKLNNYKASLSYEWQKNKTTQHQLSPLDFNWQMPSYEFEELQELLLIVALVNDDPTESQEFLLGLEPMIIVQPNYTFGYDSRLKKLRNHNFFYRGRLALSGNYLLSKNTLIPREFLETQFLQLENDWRYYFQLSDQHTIAARLAGNVTFPISGEAILPFFDLYSVGGSSSIRAFRRRQVGPGSVAPTASSFLFSGTGDILLESSLEWRSKLSRFLEFGLFVDAGNIWLYKGNKEENELAYFYPKTFLKQVAVGTGFGIRFDFEILLLRLDFAFPLSKPWLPEGQRWTGNKIQLKDGVFNLAFGYSF